MNRKQYQKRKKLRKRKMKRLMIAYLLRAIVILIPIIMMILMACGCLYIYERFTKEDEKVNKYTDIYTGRNAGSDVVPVASAENNAPGFCVVVDAGHGGSDGGTVSGKAVEKDINLSVALKLKAILENDNIEVILTRSSDENMSLAERTSVANASNADFFISLHCNYYEKGAQIAGLECYYNNSNATESKGYAESIINAVSLSEDIETRYAKTEGYYVLRNTQMPAVLVEMGFLSNYSESQKLLDDDYQESLAQRIAEGISNEMKEGDFPFYLSNRKNMPIY
ncbi:N-acetylmuramoyl-L-alanine amidase [Candidatus Merdisoma sp. JLR.KK011]|uniref:N-acetylmuramoyl-L-alanine amidase n=1 Tax=Candidatus Merdisoma sp. JLR.KK011 TaxID=3114299 RepID=UPI002FEECC58